MKGTTELYTRFIADSFGNDGFTADQFEGAMRAQGYVNSAQYYHLLKLERQGLVSVDRHERPHIYCYLPEVQKAEAAAEPLVKIETWQELAKRLATMLPDDVRSLTINHDLSITVDVEVKTIESRSL